MLDATMVELHPPVRPAPIDEPDQRADHELLQSELGKDLKVLIDAAMARSGGLNTDDDDPLVRLAEEAQLTRAEYEAVAMQADGFGWKQIAKWQRVSEGAARQSGYRGRIKLQEYVHDSGKINLNSAPLRKSDSVLEDLEGGDEA